MSEKNASISIEEANILLKIPETNELLIDTKMKVKMVLFLIKHYLMNFKEVKIIAEGESIGKALTASQTLKRENIAEIKNLETDLVDEEKKNIPKIIIILTPKKKLS